MKIDYCTLENIKLITSGKFIKNETTYYTYRNSCKRCGNPYLAERNTTEYCSKSCARAGKPGPNKGKEYSAEHKAKISKSNIGKKISASQKIKMSKKEK